MTALHLRVNCLKVLIGVVALVSSPSALAEMTRVDDALLGEVTGQAGVYLSGEVSINEAGGPIDNSYFGACSDAAKSCGARIAVQTQQNGGWFALDNLRGNIAFEGLTLQVKTINGGFGGDGALFNRDVIEIGLPDTLRLKDFQFTLATSNNAQPGEASFQQVDFGTVEMSGDVTMEGNLLVFPTQ